MKKKSKKLIDIGIWTSRCIDLFREDTGMLSAIISTSTNYIKYSTVQPNTSNIDYNSYDFARVRHYYSYNPERQ